MIRPVEVVTLFRHALEALWHCAVTTLGMVTLTASARSACSPPDRKVPLPVRDQPAPQWRRAWQPQLVERLCSVPRDEASSTACGSLDRPAHGASGRLTAEILTSDLTPRCSGSACPGMATVRVAGRASVR